jgi:ATP-dependent helicase/nuclease subunit A
VTESFCAMPADWQERQRAVDITRSCIVQAPAGSGKTELLVQRILALLAVAETPEEILAITFTRKAAAEMKLRLLQALQQADNEQPPAQAHAAETWQRARVVRSRDRELGWRLQENPSRLQLLTIDSFCALLTRRMPWLSRFGEQPRVTEDPGELYLLAAQELLSRLERGGPGQLAIERLLTHLDNRLALLRDLIVAMLGRRDQWLRHLMARRHANPRQILETGLQLYVSSLLQQTYETLGEQHYRELRELGVFAAGNLAVEQPEHASTVLLHEQESPGSLAQWLALSDLVLTSAGEIRKSLNKANGFPADKTPRFQAMKARAVDLLDHLRDNPAATARLQALRRLPETSYTGEQWQVLEALIELLPLAVVELLNVFRRRGLVDFIEIAGAAHAALGSVDEPEELLLQLDGRIRHILVDEFQDTSYAQYDLLRCLTAGWQPGDGRTLFVVGDPMQSIYRFREAEVGLYLRVCQRGLDNLPLERVVLKTNFRSKTGLVEWVNSRFAPLFPKYEDPTLGAVPFNASVAFDWHREPSIVTVHGFVGRQDRTEANTVIELIRKTQHELPEGTIAVLVRSRNHLVSLVNALKEAGMTFQAQDVDPLIERPVVQDLLSLARALQHPADRVAWLSILRAPWCGLTLADLETLCARDAKATIWDLLTNPDEQAEMFDQIRDDGRRRLDRIVPVLERALQNRGRLSMRRLVESTWLAINGPACVDEAGLQDANQYFSLLEDIEFDTPLEKLEQQLVRLFAAPDPRAGPGLQLMTIHKAKGLEFDTVIIPGLGRSVRSRERALLRWLEHPDYELLLAPLPPLKSSQPEPTYQAIGHILQDKDDLETLRLLYVAVTRAKSRLHLLGHAKLDRDDRPVPLAGSLLSVAWPSCAAEFSKNMMIPEQDEVPDKSLQQLLRLPLHWHAPQLAGPKAVSENAVRLASGSSHFQEVNVRSRRTEEGRAIGTLVHFWLERIARDGLQRWTETTLENLSGTFRAQLNSYGVPHDQIETCLRKTISCLRNAISCERGQWLLSCHRNAASELAISGLIDGQLVHATIDRTFICQDGFRWIIDYKTSGPSPGEDPGFFMDQEVKRYADQLQMYADLVRQLEPEGPSMRTALYFPAFDGWMEADHSLKVE